LTNGLNNFSSGGGYREHNLWMAGGSVHCFDFSNSRHGDISYHKKFIDAFYEQIEVAG
jgi:hypothetical protein